MFSFSWIIIHLAFHKNSYQHIEVLYVMLYEQLLITDFY